MEQTIVSNSLSDDTAKDETWCLQRVGKYSDWLRLFENAEVTLGRAIGVTHQILSASCPLMISRNHCMFKQKDDGQWTVTDNKSLNGVWVNGQRIAPGKGHRLNEGDSVQLGVPMTLASAVEFDYLLVRRRLCDVKPFLAKVPGAEAGPTASLKPRKTKRKLGCSDEAEPCDSPASRPKLYRSSAADKSRAQSCPRVVEEMAGPSDRAACRSEELATAEMSSQNPPAAMDKTGEAQKCKREVQELQAQVEQMRSQLHSMEDLRKSFSEEESRLEMETSQEEEEEGLKKQLEEALQERRKVIEELKHSRQGFEEVLQAKDKELEVTKEEKEKARAQKDEVVTQMTEVLENELQCIVCAELFIEAVTLNCAHSFCLHCIREWRKRKDECPICRQPILSQTRSLVLDNCIDSMVGNLSGDMKQRRLVLVAERKGQAVAQSPVIIHDDDSSSSSSSELSAHSYHFQSVDSLEESWGSTSTSSSPASGFSDDSSSFNDEDDNSDEF